MLNGHGDDAFRYTGICHNFSSNIFSHADLSGLKTFLSSRFNVIDTYPEPEPQALERLIAEESGVGEDCVLVTNGATDAIYMIAESLFLKEGKIGESAVIPVPTFSEYADACRMAGLSVRRVPLSSLCEDGDEPSSSSLWLCNPNNPTGAVLPKSDVLRLAAIYRLLILDQSYEDYTSELLLSPAEAVEAGNILQLHSFTKTYCIPGLRIGYVVGAPALITQLRRRLRPWSVNALAIEAVIWLIKNHVRVLPELTTYLAETQRLCGALNFINGISVVPTQVNFMLCRIDERLGFTAAELKDRLAVRHGILIRDASNFEGLTPYHFRIAAQTKEENDLLIGKLQAMTSAETQMMDDECRSQSFPDGRAYSSSAIRRSSLNNVMLAGTGSDVGKSVLAAALCRIFLQDGYHPAPFKAQNMALNSYATPDGLEIGRAQAVQAEAAGIPCHTDMNPLLLKPQSDHTSQVVLHGKPIGNRDAYEFWRDKSIRNGECKPSKSYSSSSAINHSSLKAEVCAAFDRLKARYNPIVMEGAGSISELNLRETDLVNLPMARYAHADVILVADIDRGGVFASVYGSIALQTPEDRARIKGVIINKFRGDLRLFDEGRRMIENLCGVPVLGVIPYLQDIHIEEEDSVALSTKIRNERAGRKDTPAVPTVSVAIVLLRHISNYTDFDALEQDPRVHVFYTNNIDELRKADIIILPGSKSTIDDLRELRRNGCAQAIQQAARGGTTVVGICGGYQMMGIEVCDPDHVEGDIERLPGLGLLPTTTTMSGEKVTRQTHLRSCSVLSVSSPSPAASSSCVSPSSSSSSPAALSPCVSPSSSSSSPAALSPCVSPSSPSPVASSFPEAIALCDSVAELPLSAYEIHMGETHPFGDAPSQPFAILDDGREDGYYVSDRCWGTYLHGILDNAPIVEALLAPFADRFSEDTPPFDYAAFKEEQYNLLAAHVRKHLDMEKLYEIITH